MTVEIVEIAYQIYLIPTIKVTHDKTLYGYRGIEFIWLKWSIEIGFTWNGLRK